MQIADKKAVEQWLAEMSEQLISTLGNESLADIRVVGIQQSGVEIAHRLASIMAIESEIGTLNINFHRDDFNQRGLHPQVAVSNLPWDIESRTVVLIDDVLYSGRTVRAAINTLFDYGRASRIILVVLIERSGHELPIRADVKGQRLVLQAHQHVKLDPENGGLQLIEVPPEKS